MSKVTSIQAGTTSDDVKRLQTALGQAGYQVDVDGIYGDQTKSAVANYQSANGLQASGEADEVTLGSLYGTNAQNNEGDAENGTEGHDASLADVLTGTPGYDKSGTVMQAEAKLDAITGTQPVAFGGQSADRMQEIYDKIMNREKFSYDINGDALYQQYKDQYMKNGQQAMMDTVGNASAQTGGYGNSYAETAGNAAYQDYLSRLNGIIPELEQNAYSRYQAEGDNLANEYGMAQDAYDREYKQYGEDRGYAYDTVMHMVQAGTMPSQDLISQSGLTEEDVKALATKYGYGKKTGSGGSVGNGTGEETQGAVAETGKAYTGVTAQMEEQVRQFARTGDENSYLSYISDLANNGQITEAEALNLQRKYDGLLITVKKSK